MNAARRLLTAAIAAGVLGAGAGALAACRQEPVPGVRNAAAGAERKAPDARYDDGYYDFYFKNYAHAGGDCDGYSSEPGGKTTIYEYFQCDINDWERRLAWVGIGTEVYRTSNLRKYCWARFDTRLLHGVGWEGKGLNLDYTDEADILTKNGTRLNVKRPYGLHYAPARGNFTNSLDEDSWDIIPKLSEAQKGRDVPVLLFLFLGDKNVAKAETALTEAGVSVIETGPRRRGNNYLIADARGIRWFAYNQ